MNHLRRFTGQPARSIVTSQRNPNGESKIRTVSVPSFEAVDVAQRNEEVVG